jgi:hypothetical protein
MNKKTSNVTSKATISKLKILVKKKENVRRKLVVIAEQLAVAAAKEKAILASIGDAVMACDREGRIILFNRIAEKMSGFSAKEVIGKHYNRSIKFVKESDNKPSKDFIIEAMKTGQKTTMADNTLLVKKDGSKIPVADSAEPIRYVHGSLIGCVIVFRDVSKEKEIDQAKTEFISLASHQLKNAPTAIKLLTERLLGDKIGILTEKQKEYVNDIRFSNEQMIILVNTFLNVSRIELGVFNINLTKQDACSIVKNVFNELKLTFNNQQIDLKVIFLKKNINLMLDEPLFRIIVSNLIINSMHYTEKGEIKVESNLVKKGKLFGGKKLVENCFTLQVSDTGHGIPHVVQKNIFTKFFRAENARKILSNGTGLGLYLVKSILDHSGGSIWFSSRENEKSIFYVTIPMTGMKVINSNKKISS